MERKILHLKDFILEQEGATGTTVTPNPAPETEREAKSRIASSLVKSLFGGSGLENIGTEGGDSRIDVTQEVKDSLPYKGCGATEPFKLEKAPIGVGTFKILLTYLQSKGVADYSRSIAALLDKRAVVIGVRNKIDIKKDPSNQDRFTDALYFIPGNAKDGTEPGAVVSGATGATGSTGSTGTAPKKEEDLLSKIKGKKKNEELDFDLLYKKASKVQEEKGYGILAYEEFYQLYEEHINEGWWDNSVNWVKGLFGYGDEGKDKDKKDKSVKGAEGKPVAASQPQVVTPMPTGPLPPRPTGDKISPYQITTVPSLAYYGKRPVNPKGTGIKIPGDTLYYLKESDLGHGSYKMMVEGEPIKVGRYPIGVTKFESYKPTDIFTENCGMQIHRSSTKGVGICVGPWSAGCQVFADYEEFKEFISKAERETMNANKFIYALINLDDIPDAVMKAAIDGNLTEESAETIANAAKVGATGATGATGTVITSGPLAKVTKFVQS